MRVLITGGGTAGHVNPALAIADIIMQNEPDSLIEYVGTENGIEGKLVPKKGMKLHLIRVRGLSRSLSPANVKALSMAFSARKACKKLIKQFAPDVVIGTGGYVSWPLIAAAASMRVPTVLHESNAEPGFAVKTLRNKADLVLVNFEGTRAFLKGAKAKVERVGMPVNKSFSTGSKDCRLGHISAFFNAQNDPNASVSEKRKERRILSFGGSLGAHTVNLAILTLMKEYVAQNPHVQIEHACGTREFEEVKKRFEEAGLDKYPNIKLSEYIYDMPKKMAEADLVICRSGASTLAELAVAGKAAILIPSPNVTGDQQRKNAAQLLEKNAAVVIEDEVAVDQIVETVDHLLQGDASELFRLSQNIKEFACSDCDERIYSSVRALIRQG